MGSRADGPIECVCAAGFYEDLDSVDKGSYSVLGAIEYSLLTMPSRAFALFPPAALIGTLLGLGRLRRAVRFWLFERPVYRFKELRGRS